MQVDMPLCGTRAASLLRFTCRQRQRVVVVGAGESPRILRKAKGFFLLSVGLWRRSTIGPQPPTDGVPFFFVNENETHAAAMRFE